MNFKSILRMNAILIGLGAILLVAPSVRAQQDMDPASFDDGPGVAPMAQPAPVSTTSVPANFTISPHLTSEQSPNDSQSKAPRRQFR